MGRLARFAWRAGLWAFPAIAGLGRALPILRLGRRAFAFRHDDVREVFLTDEAFQVTYGKRLRVITGGEPFVLEMSDGPAYRESLAALRGLVRPCDPEAIGAAAEAAVERGLASAGEEVEMVGLLRDATFEAISCWLGVPEPDEGMGLAVAATRLFGYQFDGGGPAPDTEAEAIARALREHVAREVGRRRMALPATKDDVLGRAVECQARGDAWFSDAAITTSAVCLLVGGPPQPPMVAPNALDQLLRRPGALAQAQSAARLGDDDALRRIVREAMRFDPLAPGLERVTVQERTLAAGTGRERRIPVGTTVFVAFASAMRDGRRVTEPKHFNASRPDASYIHFGLGVHECFGREVNAVLLQRLLAPLLRRPGLRRIPGRSGRLAKRGVYAERLWVAFDAQG